jgi:zinc transporter 1/2/3
LLFVILVTSAAGVFLPILTTRFNIVSQNNIIFVILKQFGTGIVISTAFVHLFTHADLMFGNSCLGELQYEGTTAAIFMAGLILSFFVDYLGARFVQWRQHKHTGTSAESPTATGDDKSAETSASTTPVHSHGHSHGAMRTASPMEEKINVMNLEAGIIFHSIRKEPSLSVPVTKLIVAQSSVSPLLYQVMPSSSRYSSSSSSTKCSRASL